MIVAAKGLIPIDFQFRGRLISNIDSQTIRFLSEDSSHIERTDQQPVEYHTEEKEEACDGEGYKHPTVKPGFTNHVFPFRERFRPYGQNGQCHLAPSKNAFLNGASREIVRRVKGEYTDKFSAGIP